MPARQAGTLVEVLEARACDDGDATAFTFGGAHRTYRDVWEASGRVAGRLIREGTVPGDTVVLAMGNGPRFFAAFYGTLRAGCTAVPVFPGLGPRQVVAVAEASFARLILREADDRAREVGETARTKGITVLTPADWSGAAPADAARHPDPDVVAFVQRTSGSTGEPRGVRITHRNLLTNADQLIAGMEITGADRFVSWLPVYHDMGLILMTMVPFLLGAELHLLPTSLRNIGGWLSALGHTAGTFTAAPDFAYRLALRRAPEGVRLPDLRVALNAAEPVRAGTIAAFERAAGRTGVMISGYGLAEATVGVATWPPGTTPDVDERGFVSVGPPLPGVEIRIERDGRRAAAGESGEILVASAANAAGYLGAPAATANVFGNDGFVRTGDLGYLDGSGRLYVVGRSKEIIIVGGRNLAPQEIVEIVDERPRVRMSAAVAIDRGGFEGEQAYVFAEVRGAPTARDAHDIIVGIASDLWDGLGFRPARVHLVRPGTIPLTHNGKVRTGELRERFLAGTLGGLIET